MGGSNLCAMGTIRVAVGVDVLRFGVHRSVQSTLSFIKTLDRTNPAERELREQLQILLPDLIAVEEREVRRSQKKATMSSVSQPAAARPHSIRQSRVERELARQEVAFPNFTLTCRTDRCVGFPGGKARAGRISTEASRTSERAIRDELCAHSGAVEANGSEVRPCVKWKL